MKLTTAVITAAGLGSRMLPVTSAVQKVMLPILNRPVVDYVVSDCLAAGATKIIFVINPGSRELQDYYLGSQTVENLLKHQGKTDELNRLKTIHSEAEFTFVEQDFETDGYGTNPPLLLAAPHIPADEAFILAYGDGWLQRSDGKSEIAELVKTFQESESDGAITGLEMSAEDISRYGALGLKKIHDKEYLDGFIEKPAAGEAPSNLSNLGLYVFTHKILDFARQVKPNDRGELYLTDAVKAAADDMPVIVHRATGRFLDAGNVQSWLKANLAAAEADPELSRVFGSLQR